MRDDQEQNTDDKTPTIGKEGPCGFSCGDCARRGDCEALAQYMEDTSRDWSSASLQEIMEDFMGAFSCVRETLSGDDMQLVVSSKVLEAAGIYVFPEPQYEFSRPVWRGHRFVVSDDARAVSRICRQILKGF